MTLRDATAQVFYIRHNYSVTKHAGAGIDSATVRAHFGEATELIDNGTDPDCAGFVDVRMCALLYQVGTLGTFGDGYDGLDNITGTDELDQVYAVPSYNFKVVDSITDVTPEGGYVGGVTKVLGQKNVVIASYMPSQVWAHEVGHTVGIPDQYDCDHRIMYYRYTTDQKTTRLEERYNWETSLDGVECCCGYDPIGTSFTATGADSSVTLHWEESDPGSVPYYQLYRSDACWGPFLPFASVAAGDPAYTPDGTSYTYHDNTARYLHQYYYEIATSLELVKANAQPISGRNSMYIQQPYGLAGTGSLDGNGKATVALHWTAPAPSGVNGYYVYRSEETGMEDCSATISYLGAAVGTSFSDTTARGDGVLLYYRVRAYNASIGSDVSNQLEISSFPDPGLSYFVPQAGSVGSPIEGNSARAYFRACPNNDGTSLPNNARVKVFIRNAKGVGLAGVPAAAIYTLFNGGTVLQGFTGPGADSVIANSQYNPSPACPDVRRINADAPTDTLGVAYITFVGASGTPGVGLRDAARKWGHYDTEIPVFSYGHNLHGRLTSSSANGSYALQIKNYDFTYGGLGTALNQGERVSSAEFNYVGNNIGQTPSPSHPFAWWADFNSNGVIDASDFNLIVQHFGHDCLTPDNP
jgi:hypothetical protein